MNVEKTAAAFSLIDYREQGVRFSPSDMCYEHSIAKDWLKKSLSGSSVEKKVVVTHHLPHKNSLDSRFEGLSQAMFASNLDELMEIEGVTHWIHGHTHILKDYYFASCRVVCSPYSREDSSDRSQLGVIIEL